MEKDEAVIVAEKAGIVYEVTGSRLVVFTGNMKFEGLVTLQLTIDEHGKSKFELNFCTVKGLSGKLFPETSKQ